AKLVHGDLSEYNILYGRGHPYLIDMGQAVTRDHPHAPGFLKRDLEQLNRFFNERCTTREISEILEELCGTSPQ
ncbi:MAG TPA: RIO1 family regulatory kinase/ATPase, partial [Methanospirillum sp.]|nr:RIO1 family regulatory kinase/ATPase [Methanospirillum sp.]